MPDRRAADLAPVARRVALASVAVVALALAGAAGTSLANAGAGAQALFPHGVCLLWDPRLLTLHVASDALIAGAYFAIPLLLLLVLRRRPDLVHRRTYLLFSAFILLCGLTHVMGIWVLWHPDFTLQAALKMVTGVVSAISALAVWALMPALSRLPSPAQLEQANGRLLEQIDERERAERARDQSERFVRTVLDTLHESVIACDARGQPLYRNQAARAALGRELQPGDPGEWARLYALGETDGTTPLALEQVPLYRALHGETVSEARVSLLRPGTRALQIVANACPMRDAGGELMGAVVTFRDISATLESERALRESESRLAQAQKMEALGQLTGGVAHDFNNLLTVILGNLALAQRAHPDHPETLERVGTASQAAMRGAELTRSLLAFARKQVLAPCRVDLCQQVPAMHGLLARSIGETVELRYDVERGLWPVSVDPAQLETGVLNLVLNARHAMPQGGRITVSARNAAGVTPRDAAGAPARRGDYVELSVSDEGAGMSPEVLSRALEPFFTTREGSRGTGLGLSMVDGFVKQSSGQLEIHSAPGAGTRVSLYLPRSAPGDGEALPVPVGEAVAARRAEAQATVLVVEDDAGVRAVVVASLSALGYRVLVAENGPAALALLDTGERVDLLLTDMVMPGGMNGAQVAVAVLERRPAIRVLYTSGYAAQALGPEGTLDVPGDMLGKPYCIETLRHKVASALA